MTTQRLYRTPVPDSALRSIDEESDAQIERLGLLEGNTNVQPVSGGATDLRIEAVYRGKYADRLATELIELLDSQVLQTLSLAPIDGQAETDGYYAVEGQDGGREAPQSAAVNRVQGRLVKEGTRSSHRRTVHTRLSQPDPGNVFGNDTTAIVGVPAAATRVTWFDRSYSDSEPIDVVETVSAKHGDVDLVDARAVDLGDDPVLVYDLPYDRQGDVDPSVWDPYGTDSIRDDDGHVQWQRVFDPAHDPRADAEFVFENGLIRLWLQDGPEKTIRADEWDPAAEEWLPIELDEGEWVLVETDLRRIGALAIEAQCVFSDGDDEYPIDLRLERGYERPQWFVPQSVSEPIPEGLESLLEPIANESVFETGASIGLVSRREVRR